MGSVTYNFLADSILFNEKCLENKFKNESIERIEKELVKYRKHCIDNYGKLMEEIKSHKSSLKVFSSVKETNIDLLKQTALYVDQFIIFDPLFELTDFQSEITRVTGEYLGFETQKFDKESLWRAAKFLKDITPMVAANYVKIFPLSYHFEAPKELPLRLPSNYYNDLLPKPLKDFFFKNVSVHPLEKIETGGWAVSHKELTPCRSIVVDFKDKDYTQGLIYFLFEMEIINYDKKTGLVQFSQTLPDTIPDHDHFNAWVTQSVNSASKAYFDRIHSEITISSSLNSTYLCDNNFNNRLIKQNFNTKETIPSFTANQIMNFELPFLENIDTQKLMDVRTFEEDVFTNFRLELERTFRDLRNESDDKVLKLKAENFFHEIYEVQGHKIKTKIQQLKKQATINTSIGVGGLASSFQTSGFSLLASAIALGKGYKDYSDYQKQIKNNPGYLLWKVKKEKK